MLLTGATFSCTDDWDDHYEVKSLGSGTLWQAISGNEQLSNFTAVLEATGYKSALDGSQVFTVFAPTNDKFSEAERDALIQQYNAEKARGVKESKNTVVKEFVQNHIALYNYSVSSVSPDTVVSMMNGKFVSFTGSSFANHAFINNNIQTGNGVLFTIDGQARFEPNMFEYLEKDASIDSVRNFIYHYNIDKFFPEQSVEGEVVDGKIQYLDSVTVTENEILTDWLDALINDEDSNYVMLAPTNEVWKEQLEQNKKYFVYDNEVAERDSFEFIFPRINILAGTMFSTTTNPGLQTGAAIDSVMSTNAVPYELREIYYGSYAKKYYQYDKPFDPATGIFAGTTDAVCSNGVIKKASEWKIDRSQTFLREIVMEGESSSTLDSLNIRSSTNPRGNTLPPIYHNVTLDNKFYNQVSGHGYLEIAPSASSNISNALFDVRDVLSNVPYDVYVVIAPAEAGDTLAAEELKVSTRFRCALQCHGLDGHPYYISPTGEMEPVFANNDHTKNPSQPTRKTYVDNLSNADGISVDSVYVGTYTFPTSSYNVDEAQVKLLITGRAGSGLTKIIRLDCIVFKPHIEEDTPAEP